MLREGDIHPDLANRLADEAARCAALRAADVHPRDRLLPAGRASRSATTCAPSSPPTTISIRTTPTATGWRSSKASGSGASSPQGMRSMSVESLLWPTGDGAPEEAGVLARHADELQRAASIEDADAIDCPEQTAATRRWRGRQTVARLQPWDLESDRYKTWEGVEANAAVLWSWLVKGQGRKLAPAIRPRARRRRSRRHTVFRSPTSTGQRRGRGAFGAHGAAPQPARRARSPISWSRSRSAAAAISIRTSRRRMDKPGSSISRTTNGDFRYRAGCTLLIDPTDDGGAARHQDARERSPTTSELERVRRFLTERARTRQRVRQRARRRCRAREPFALLHRDGEA